MMSPSGRCSSTPSASKAPQSYHALSKPQRILACVSCQQRKVKCDRKFPCANCIRHCTQCVPSTQTRPRRRRFPERQLLDRLRSYEELLRQNNIKFEPLHKESPSTNRSEEIHEETEGSDVERPDSKEPSNEPVAPGAAKIKSAYEAKNIWHALSRGFRGVNNDGDLNDGVREVMAGKTWDCLFNNDDHLLFSTRQAAVELGTLHPEPVHVFKLWNIYLENVNPLLRVTHTPTLQGRIIEAAGNLTDLPPALEALMFSIYSVAVLSLTDDCQTLFGMPRGELLKKFQFGSQQALLNCGFLRSADRDCMTALYLYLISVHPTTDPRSLSSMLGIASRIAQRMGLQYESNNSKYPILEAEMRRRLWWSFVLFDARVSELSDYRTTMLTPTWDCRIPLNVNDHDLRPEMKEPPLVQGPLTEGLFVILRCEIGDFVRRSSFHLDFTNPFLKAVAQPLAGRGSINALEKILQKDYLDHCDSQNPLHFMTTGMVRSALSKNRLLEYYSQCYSEAQTELQWDNPILYAFRMLESDTEIINSPLTQGYTWFLQSYFPLPAYIHIVQELIKQPTRPEARHAWEVMSDNYEARLSTTTLVGHSVFKAFTKIILQAWEALEKSHEKLANTRESPPVPPRIVLDLKRRMTELQRNDRNSIEQQPGNLTTGDVTGLLMSIPMGFATPDSLYDVSGSDSYLGDDPLPFPNFDMAGQPSASPSTGLHQIGWPSALWDFRGRRGW